ncbi:TPA: hypothetical protein QDB15_005357 [Burkholderia vietnamiensis]|uniref:hypothetical protein n=1 Tax=Burkholderia cepacia complex TaxID=87882 RepID=UPI000A74D248|nr:MULTISPECIES: hypothetical protein [Burkholderia cepacia complex]MCA8194657.1 hypothetical protein [Burkholderia vietnamiensis]MCA8206562.1 hypothetical protein [Burkholderia vietnamiensis]MCA8227100.1 hypothetical protein [Burkholderia vietnamiensis]MCA8286526.1 hypothetical protein [Burkholderia vietnamiensis]MDF3089381.1 hypothetical protein [Burkholderia semiarida]
MAKYCVTAANHNGTKDGRASEFKVWEWKLDTTDNKSKWFPLGKKPLNFVANLLATGNAVVSAKEVKKGNELKISTGAAIELELRIAKNDENFKITDLPEF